MGEGAPLRLSLAVEGPYALVDSLRLQRFGRSDPTVALEVGRGIERFAKCARTAAGSVTMVAWRAQEMVEVALYGAGSEALVPRLEAVLGLADRAAFRPEHPRLVPLRAAFLATRLVSALSLSELHAILILQQRVTFAEAARAWQAMVRQVGERAPGPVPLWLAPRPEHWLGLSQPAARAIGIDAKRWEALQCAARAAAELEARAHDPEALADYALAIPGTGPWTTGLLRGLGLGDADAVVLGDVHMPHDVSAFLEGVPHGSDARMLELLEPFRPHRFRVVRVMLGRGRRRL